MPGCVWWSSSQNTRFKLAKRLNYLIKAGQERTIHESWCEFLKKKRFRIKREETNQNDLVLNRLVGSVKSVVKKTQFEHKNRTIWLFMDESLVMNGLLQIRAFNPFPLILKTQKSGNRHRARFPKKSRAQHYINLFMYLCYGFSRKSRSVKVSKILG